MQTKVAPNCKVALPQAACVKLGLHAGDELLVGVVEDGVIPRARTPETKFSALRGVLPKPVRALTLDEMNGGYAMHLARKHCGGFGSE